MTSSARWRSAPFRRGPQRTVATLKGRARFAAPLIRLAVAITSWVIAALGLRDRAGRRDPSCGATRVELGSTPVAQAAGVDPFIPALAAAFAVLNAMWYELMDDAQREQA